jgi:hypothetical protein
MRHELDHGAITMLTMKQWTSENNVIKLMCIQKGNIDQIFMIRVGLTKLMKK